MAQKTVSRRVTGQLAELSGRSDDELRLVLTLATAAALVTVALRMVRTLTDLGSNILARPGTR